MTDLELYTLLSENVYEVHDDRKMDGEVRLFIRSYNYHDFFSKLNIDTEWNITAHILSDGDICVELSELQNLIDDYETFEKLVVKNLVG